MIRAFSKEDVLVRGSWSGSPSRKLTILCPKQWGHHIDSYKMALFFQREYTVTYLCWDHGFKRVPAEAVNVIYVSRSGSLLARNLRYLRTAYRHLNRVRPEICFIKYFVGCSITKLAAANVGYILDVRTGSVHQDGIRRRLYDSIIKLESLMFRNITVISEALGRRLGLENRSTVLPLGSDIKSADRKTFESIRLLYVGTLNNRNISETIKGIARFRDRHGKNIVRRYTIVGDGREYQLLKEQIKAHRLQRVVTLKGRVPYCELKSLLDSHNVGVSFVPMTHYYDCQPVGKTFDYLLSGLVVIATGTSENRKVIQGSNGVCIADSADSFADGLYQVWQRRKQYDSDQIRRSVGEYSWDNIYKEFGAYLDRMIPGTIEGRA